YLFFNPWFSLFKIKKGDTEYGIGWLPFGGYVKIAGMIDESFDKKQLEGEVQPWEFRAKPAWQRLIIMLGGIIVNVLLGIIIYIGITYVYGTTYYPNSEIKYGIQVDSIGSKLGLQNGDKIISLGDVKFDKFDRAKFVTSLILDDIKTIKVERNGQEMDITVPEDAPSILAKAKDNYIFAPRIPFIIEEVVKDGPANKAGIKKDDKIVAIDGKEILWEEEIRKEIKKHKNTPLSITVLRNNSDTLTVNTKLGDDGMLGIRPYGPEHYFTPKSLKYSLAESIPIGTKRAWNFITGQVKAFGKIFQGKIKAKDSVGSVISMGKMFGDTWNAQKFWTLTGMLSLLLAFLNLLPIPGLDGGHAVFVIYEMITGRKPSDKVVEVATTIGFILLIALMAFALGNDIRKLF
ncbi:MAG TPA: RIP metalloprotease RseP, partial [Bacteroidetes bacterium]|nr:RIP metalloprotease RseP [Bacteroidota bacterium]